jgi:membrane associated rhomboid family serine protease
MELTLTLVIVIITSLISIGAFSNQKIMQDLIFYPPAITQRNQWYRFFSCGLIHADYIHLIFNMYALYSFGTYVEAGFPYRNVVSFDNGFVQIFGQSRGKILYFAMYVLALGFALLPTYFRHRNNYHYRSLGASGAVSAVIFAALVLEPRMGMGLIIIPRLSIPGYIFAPLFLIISHYLGKRGKDNINHSAHIWGAIFGVVFVLAACYLLTDHDPIRNFIQSVKMDVGGSAD